MPICSDPTKCPLAWEGYCTSIDCRIESFRRQVVSGAVVPEPTTALLLACGLAGLAAAGRRRSLHR